MNKEAKSIVTSLGIAERVEKYAEQQAFLTLKDHKQNFQSNPMCRLINPAKSAIGIISKTHLDRVNRKLRENLNVNQWRNTDEVVKWFNDIPDKPI